MFSIAELALTPALHARGMLHDPQVYPDPERFSPERFEGSNKTRVDDVDPSDLVFGFGRRSVCAYFILTSMAHKCIRQCPGQQLAEITIWLMAAYVVATMDITPAKDVDGRDVVPPADFHSGFVV